MTNSLSKPNNGLKSLTNNSSRVQLFGPDQILVYERERLQQSLVENDGVDKSTAANGFSNLGNVLNKNNSKAQLRQVVDNILPKIVTSSSASKGTGTYNQKEMHSWRKSSER